MAYLRDRRAFGNIGTRKFRGARFGDPLSPRGPQYTKEGLILDYSTDVGPFTIIDQSGQDNTATLYSGRGLTMDGVSDLIDFGSPTFSEPVTSVTGYARSTDTSINLGLASATLAGNDTWETFSADTAAKDYGDAQWFNGTDTYVIKDIPGFRSSDSSGSIEATFITTATTASTLFASCDTASDSNRFQFQLDSSGRVQIISRVASFHAVQTLASFNDGQQHTVKLTSNGTSWQIEVDGSVEAIEVISGSNSGRWFSDIPNRDNITVGVSKRTALTAFATASISEVIVSDGTSTPVLRYTGLGATPWDDTIGSNDGTLSGVDQTVTEYFTNPDFILGTGYNGDLSDIRCLGATGTVLGHWTLADWSNPAGNTSNGKTIVDSGPNGYHGTCTGCSGFTGEATIPQTADRNWNKYDWNGGTPILSDTGTMLVSASDANDQIDALGNAILEPRRNTQQLNLFGEGEYSSTPDSDSLDLTTAATWELWGNFYGDYGVDKAFISKFEFPSNKAFYLYQNDAELDSELTLLLSGDGTATAMLTIPVTDAVVGLSITYDGSSVRSYVNGIEVVVTLVSGVIPSSLFPSTADLLIGQLGGGKFLERKIGSAKIYNRALTADEVLTNYESQKSLYLNVFPFTLT